MTTDLFIWYYRTNVPKGIPLMQKTILKDVFDLDKPKKVPEQPWMLYNSRTMGFPITDEKYQFPQEMYLVVLNNIKEVCFDYVEDDYKIKLVSQDFFQFLNQHGLDKGFEKANLTILNQKGELLTSKKYYALRFCLFDDQLFEFNKKEKIRIKREFGGTEYVYPQINLIEEKTQKSVFAFEESAYRKSLIFKGDLISEMLKNFYCPEIYSIKDFPYIYENQYNWDILPQKNEYLVTGG